MRELTEITISEWAKLDPESREELKGLSLDEDKYIKDVVCQLNGTRIIEILELKTGLSIKSRSYVGSIRLGNLKISIYPKLRGARLVDLLKYAYGLRDLKIFDINKQEASKFTFQELIILQLLNEVAELISRGVHRQYINLREDLVFLRGRIDFNKMACQGGVIQAAVPCSYYPRLIDSLLNRVIKAGLMESVRLTSDFGMRSKLNLLVRILDENVSSIKIYLELLRNAERQITRLTKEYEAALKLIELIVVGQGISLESGQDGERIKTPGFLFDMNRFFQALISRFLKMNLPEYEVYEEYRLKDMMDYVRGFNPKGRRAPKPRPDFVIRRGRETAAILDTKYRDLWENELPNNMLYQLCIYALSQKKERTGIIIYPVAGGGAKEARIEICDPLEGGQDGLVILRPLDLNYFHELVTDAATFENRKKCRDYAKYLVFGD